MSIWIVFLIAIALAIGSFLNLTSSGPAAQANSAVPNSGQPSWLTFTLCPLIKEQIPSYKPYVDPKSITYTFWRPGGHELSASLQHMSTSHYGCREERLPIQSDVGILWFQVIPSTLARQLKSGVILQTKPENAYQAQNILPVHIAKTSPTKSLPIGSNLLPLLQIAPFGIEERAQMIQHGNTLELHCHAGQKPAGLLLAKFGFTMPDERDILLEAAYNTLEKVSVNHQAGETFQIATMDKVLAQKGETLNLGTFIPAQRLSHVSFLLGARTNENHFQPESWESFSLLCPISGGTITLQSLSLSVPETKLPYFQAAWFSKPLSWAEDGNNKYLNKLWNMTSTWNIRRIYIPIPIDPETLDIKDVAKFRKFIAEARGRGITVWAVERDPHAVLPDELLKLEKRVAKLALYNRTSGPNERLSGIQYEIAPYPLSGYSLDKPAWNQAYLHALIRLKTASELPIETVVPDWFINEKTDAGFLLKELAPVLDSLVVLTNRTDKQSILSQALPFLRWGENNRKKVWIALESAPSPATNMHVYRPQEEGNFIILPIQDYYLALLLKWPTRLPEGQVYAYSHTMLSPIGRHTFHGHSETLKEMLPALTKQCSHFTAFAGISIHGLE